MTSSPSLRQAFDADLCVVGAGPVGLALALESADAGRKVLLIDAGSDAANPDADDASRAEIIDPKRHVPMDLAVRRGLGGTSWLWGGRCVPFDALDFEARAAVPDSGWPIGPGDVAHWYDKAVHYLDCGEADFEAPAAFWPELADTVGTQRIERFSRNPQRARQLGERVRAHANIKTVFGVPVTRLVLAADGRSLEGLTLHGRGIVKARDYALACGGLETTRLLLIAQRERPEKFGGADGPLGRHYMGHIEGVIADVTFAERGAIHAFDYRLGEAGAYGRRILTLTAKAQRVANAMNIAFWPDNLPYHDPRHRSGIKSLVFLMASVPALGRKLVSEAIRLGIVGPAPHRRFAHALNVAKHPIDTAQGAIGVLAGRYSGKPRRPGWLPPTPDNSYALHYRGEQAPRAASRVTLGDERDGFGMARLKIDLRFEEADARATLAAHDALDAALRRVGKGVLKYRSPREGLMEAILAQAHGGYHQLGLTRMGTDPARSIVDADCRVHGVANLHVAGSAVFPTGGHANPTLLATAMAARLAARLAVVDVEKRAAA